MPGFDLPWRANQDPGADGASGSARGWSFPRHCEQRSDEAIQKPSFRDGASAPDPESRDSGLDPFASPRNDGPYLTAIRFGSTISNIRGNSSINAISSARRIALPVNLTLPLATASGNDVCFAITSSSVPPPKVKLASPGPASAPG